jgi:hypothetical protein
VIAYDGPMNEATAPAEAAADLEAERAILICDDSIELQALAAEFGLELVTEIAKRIACLPREAETALLLAHSLCPLHRIDYAICFDDEAPECAPIRAIHPDHDT